MQRKHDTCTVKGCGKASNGKQYCEKHGTAGQRRTLTRELSALIRSDCCTARCVIGAAHDNGEQYCSACKEACCWKTAC